MSAAPTPPGSLLVLDAGGVLIAEPVHAFFAALDISAGYTAGYCGSQFRSHWRRPLWVGEMSVKQFFIELAEMVHIEPARLEARLVAGFQLLPAARRVPAWAETGPVWLLSNHRAEWLRPILAAAGLDQHLDTIIISSEVGMLKPEPDIFRLVLDTWDGPASQITYVDDQASNLAAARAQGIGRLVEADPAGEWTRLIDCTAKTAA
jgi:putative hydrolase of the HAD superfamily